MKTQFILYMILLISHSLIGQIQGPNDALKPIEIRNSKFYQEGLRLKPGKSLEKALAKSENNEVMKM